MRAVKAVQIPYSPTRDVLELLETFRGMVNHCIRVGLKKGITSRFRLSNEVYHELTRCGYHSWYVLSAIEVATAILNNYRKAKRKKKDVRRPYARTLMAKLGNQAYRIVGDQLRIPIKPREYFYIPLHKRALQFLSDATLKLGSITLTTRTVTVVFSKTSSIVEPEGYVAIDVNEDNITAVSSNEEVKFFDLSKLRKASYGYFERKRALQQKYCKDRRVLKKALLKLSENYHSKTSTILHQVSTSVVEWCRNKNYGLIHEDLKGLRKSVNKRSKRFNKFNGKVQQVSKRSKKLKRRLNNWWFRKFLNQIAYKCAWEGVKSIESKHTKGSSSTCPICGSKLAKYPNGQVECRKCGFVENRHIVACLNLLRWEGAVRPRPPPKCSRDPRPNKPFGDEDKRGEQKGGSCATRMQH